MINWLKNMFLLATEPIDEKPKVTIQNVEVGRDIVVEVNKIEPTITVPEEDLRIIDAFIKKYGNALK